MMYYIKPHNEYVCSISVDSDFDFGNGWSLMGETATHFYMSTDNIDKAYTVAKALGVNVITVNTAWEIDPCLLEYDIMYLDTLQWTVEYWDNLPVEMINAIVATGDTYSFDLYTKAYAYMRNGFDVANNQCDIDWDAPAPELPVIEPEPVEVITPQEVVSEPQEDCLSTTTLNEDKTMSIILPDFSTNGNTFTLVPVEFTSIWYEVPAVELTGQCSELTCHISDGWTGQSSDVLEGWTGQFSELTCDVLNGQCCNIDDAPKPVEQLSDAQYRVQQACAKMARRSAYASPVRCGSLVNTPTITTKSGDIVKVSDEEFAELEKLFDKAMAKPKFPFTIVNNNSLQGNQINPDCSRTKAIIGYGQVSEFKSTLFNLDNFDVVKQAAQALLDMLSPDEYNKLRDKYGVDVMKKAFNTLQGDVRTRIRSMINKANTIRNGIELTVVATQAPSIKPSSAKFASNFNSLVIAKYRELNGGFVKDSLILNKLTSALRANDVEAYTKYVTTFNNPTAVALHRQAYDAVVSAS